MTSLVLLGETLKTTFCGIFQVGKILRQFDLVVGTSGDHADMLMTWGSSISLRIRRVLQKVQSELGFESWSMYPLFNSTQGLGRIALISSILGALLGAHLVLLAVILLSRAEVFVLGEVSLGPERIQLIGQWCAYISFVAFFHLSEFFAQAIYNPRVVSSESFMVNHSVSYTAAAIVSVIK
jgi:hypothetical protein